MKEFRIWRGFLHRSSLSFDPCCVLEGQTRIGIKTELRLNFVVRFPGTHPGCSYLTVCRKFWVAQPARSCLPMRGTTQNPLLRGFSQCSRGSPPAVEVIGNESKKRQDGTKKKLESKRGRIRSWDSQLSLEAVPYAIYGTVTARSHSSYRICLCPGQNVDIKISLYNVTRKKIQNW